MAIDNLNYMSSWMPAWQQTDKYSSQPWCLKSKNLDIFSSSKSVKATAFSEPVVWEWDIIAKDGDLVLKTDWKVYDSEWTLIVDPSTNFPVYQVSYTWSGGTYSNAQRWTPKDLVAKYEWDELESFTVFTDRSSYVWRRYKEIVQKEFDMETSYYVNKGSLSYTYGYQFYKTDTTHSSMRITIHLSGWKLWGTAPIRIYAAQNASSHTDVSIDYIDYIRYKYYYDQQTDSMQPIYAWTSGSHPQWDIKAEWWILLNVPTMPTDSDERWLDIHFKLTQNSWVTDWAWSGNIYIDMNWWPTPDHRMLIDWVASDGDYAEYYTYLPVDSERKLQKIWSYGYSPAYWMKGTTIQRLYKWVGSWITVWWQNKTIYDFINDMGWETDASMDVVWMMIWNEQVYMIWNIDWDWYIIPCDLTWWMGTPYIAYWCTFLGVENIDYLLYLVWEDRWISTLWVFNQQELVPVVWGNKENTATDLVWVDEQYKFDWNIVNWRKNLILTTKDNRIFQYWQTYGGKWWAFIHELPANAVIKSLKANWNDLEIAYSITVNDTTTNYSIKYQDDTPMKRYNTEWSATYPIVLGNHILEKEESDLYTSFILPSASTKLEFWGMANHYHFWTFTSEDNATLSESESYKIKGTSWTYALKFIERNDNQYTFRLEWDLPVQTSSEMKITDSNNTVVLNYTDFNHFRKIWTIETDKYLEWEFRFHNLNNKLELPKSHSLQIMVKGKGTANYTPELFAVDLVANQRDRW